MKDRVACVVRRALCAAGVFGLVLPTVAELSPNLYKGAESLVLQFDGIDNQATGSHDATATTWKSLVGGKTLTLTEGCANFADDATALTCVERTAGAAATGTGMSSIGYKTIEVVLAPAKKSTSVVWTHGDPYGNGHSFYLNSAGWATCKTYPATLASGDNVWGVGTYNLTAVYGAVNFLDYFFSNGESSTLVSRNATMWEQDASGTSVLGAYKKSSVAAASATSPFVGKIHTIRFNSRQLTPDEMRWNAHLDEARFGYNGNVHVLGFPEEYGTPSPAYGSSEAEDIQIAFSPGPLTDYEDGAKAVPLGDGYRVCCLGYVRDGNTSVTNPIPDAPLAFADGMTVAWIWERQYRVTVTGTEQCPSVTLNGESGIRVTKWIAEGSPVTVCTMPLDAGSKVVAWRGASTGMTFASDGTATFSASAGVSLEPWTAASSTLRYWRGTASASAKAAANWVDATGANALPADGSTVVLDAESADKPMTWDLNDVTLGNWVQSGYAGTVTFQNGKGGYANGTKYMTYGVLAADGETRVIEVSGDVILASGKWMHPSQPSNWKSTDETLQSGLGVYRLAVHAGGSFEIAPGATVSAASRGFYGYNGPGSRRTGDISGGSHGGLGGSAGAAQQFGARPCYGNLYAPITIGSGSQGMTGGGAIELKAGGAFVLNGTLTVKAGDSTTYYGGAGGSVWVTAASLVGNGTIVADGGAAPSGGAGGGGRVSLCLTGEGQDFSGFTGTVSALPGGPSGTIAAGTIYRETLETAGNGVLEIRGRGAAPCRLATAELPDIGRDYTFSKVRLLEGGRLGVMADTRVKIDALETVSKSMSSIALFGGTLCLPADCKVANMQLAVIEAGSKVEFDTQDGSGVLCIAASGDFVCDAPMTVDALKLEDGATLRHTKNTDDGWLNANLNRYVRLDLTSLGDIEIDAGAQVNVDSCGRGQTAGPGGQANCGGSYGGLANGASTSKCYGSLTKPYDFGSGASAGSMCGGGVAKLTCGGTLTVNGTITASSAFYNGGNVSASGGSVWIETKKLAGSGVITASAGTCSTSKSRGGGGRVAVYLTGEGETFEAFRAAGGSITAYGGRDSVASTAATGGAGTIYLSQVTGGVARGTLIVDNGTTAASGKYETVITPSVTDATIDDLVITNAGLVRVTTDAKLVVRGTFDTHGRFLADVGDTEHVSGIVEFAGDGVATVLGTNEFANLAIATPGKTVRFGTGGTLTRIKQGGKLEIAGDETEKVFLRSTEDGTSWLLDVVAGAEADVVSADVKDSDAETLGGNTIVAKSSTGADPADNNKNWNFIADIKPGELIVWTGAADASWSSPGNWDRGRVPVVTDVVQIPAVEGQMPVSGAKLVLYKLIVEDGASFSLNGFPLTVSNDVTVAGSLVCTGVEAIDLHGNVDFSGSFAAAGSTVTIEANGDYAFNPGGNVFNDLYVRSCGALQVSDSLKARKFACEPTAPLVVTVASGKVLEANEFVVHGTEAAMVEMVSATSGEKWYAKANVLESVYGVRVRDAEATGLEIFADRPAENLGGNVRWTFGGAASRWIGADKGDFSDPANWSDGVAPDALTRVVFDSDAQVTLDREMLVREMRVDAGTTVLLPGTNVLYAENSLVIENGATLSLNVPAVFTNNVIVRAGGTLTHEAMGKKGLAITNRIDLTVLGDMTIEKTGTVNVNQKGFLRETSGGYGYGQMGASHGGRGNAGTPCYGSAFHPTEPGSPAASWDTGADGGGVVYLRVGGVLTVAGDITANGGKTVNYGASGGSVWITAGCLMGGGTISANAGNNTSQAIPGGGGRVAIYVAGGDFDRFTGSAVAYGSNKGCAAGTVYLASTEAPKAGRLVIDGGNSGLSGWYAELPASGPVGDDPKDFKDVTVEVRNGGGVSFTENLKIAELEYTATKVSVKLNDHEVFIESMRHRNADKRPNRGWVAREIENRGPNGLGRYLWNQGLLLLVK